MSKQDAAREALRTHDALRKADEREPTLDAEGKPRNPVDWLAWHEHEYKPAHHEWVCAMDRLDIAIGEHVSRHPINFRPICEALIRT